MKKYGKEDHKALATWALDCAERVLPLFERSYPDDDRPRRAIETGREWVRTGVFKMVEIRGTSLAAHAAAKTAKENVAACNAAHAAGQAVATAHVPQHAYGAAYYALRAITAADPAKAEENTAAEHTWQAEHLPEHLRQDVMKRIKVGKKGEEVTVKLLKGDDF